MTSMAACASMQQIGPATTRYRPEIDGLRAVAIAAVITHHFSDRLLPGGFLGVDMFFVISGYVITASLIGQRQNGNKDLVLGFYSRRIKRLAPALIACVLFTCLLGDLFINPELAEHLHSFQAGGLALFGLSNFHFFAAATDYFGSSAALNLFTHTWSLGVEEQFYLVFPALVLLTGGVSRQPNGHYRLVGALMVMTAASLALNVVLLKTNPVGAYFLMPPRLWELSVGCLVAMGVDRRASTTWIAAPASLLIVAALLMPPLSQFYSTLAVVIGTAGLIQSIQRQHFIHRFLTNWCVVQVGLISYSLYLWHWSILSISRWTIGIAWWTAPFQLAIIVALACASYILLERPLRHAEWSPSRFKTILIGLAFTIGGAGVVAVLKSKPVGHRLYLGSPAKLEAKGVETLLYDKWRDGALVWSPRNCVLSTNAQVGIRIDSDACLVKSSSGKTAHRFLVVGNSLSAAEFEMYTVVSGMGLGSVIVTSAWGASPVPEIENSSPWSKANEYYWSVVFPSLVAQLRPGDVVVLIAEIQHLTPATMSSADTSNIALLAAGLNRIASELRKKGVQLIFQNGNPFIREAGCTPDMAVAQWFNFGRASACVYFSKDQSLTRRQPLTDALHAVAEANENFHMLDLFPVLCPGEVCRFYNEHEVFLYRDIFAHPSVEAGRLARPLLLTVAEEALSAADNSLKHGQFPK